MVKKLFVALVLGLTSIGCVAPNGSNTSVTLDDILAFTGDKIAEVNKDVQQAMDTAAATATELEAARATIASLEAIVGPADIDNDGIISSKEASDFYGRVALSQDPTAQDLATNGDVWKKLMLLLGAAAAARKFGHKLPPGLQWLTAFFGTPGGPTSKTPKPGP